MTWILVGIAAAILFAAYRGWLSMRHMSQLSQGIPIIQLHAFNNVLVGNGDVTPDGHEQLVSRHIKTVQRFEVAYTVAKAPNGIDFIHHVSGKAPGKPETWIIQNMLLIMSTLLSEFKTSGIENTPEFQIEQDSNGVHHIEFQLTPSQHEALRALVDEHCG